MQCYWRIKSTPTMTERHKETPGISPKPPAPAVSWNDLLCNRTGQPKCSLSPRKYRTSTSFQY